MEKSGKKPATMKSRGAFHVLRVAFYMLRRRSSSKPPVQVDVVEKSTWRRLMAAMRPFQATCLPSSPAPAIKESSADEFYHDVTIISPPLSPDYEPRVIEDAMSSRYASAEDLQELYVEQKDEETGNPNEIDVQAEEFIAKFYEEMRLQRIESMERNTDWLEKESGEEKHELVLDVVSACAEGALEMTPTCTEEAADHAPASDVEADEQKEVTVDMTPACQEEVAEGHEIKGEIIPACKEEAAETCD